MRKIVSCEFNLDTACVELRLDDGTLLSIDCTAVENEVANSMYQRSELDWKQRKSKPTYRIRITKAEGNFTRKRCGT